MKKNGICEHKRDADHLFVSSVKRSIVDTSDEATRESLCQENVKSDADTKKIKRRRFITTVLMYLFRPFTY